MDPNSPDLDIFDSASTTSSTLVLTPLSGHNNKWHVDRVFTSQSVTPVYKPPQLPNLRLLALRPTSNTMFQNQGKGPVQPHVNNLPRRRPLQKPINTSSDRQGRAAALSSDSSSSNSNSRSNSPSSGVTDSVSVHSTHNSSPSRSPQRRPPSPPSSVSSSQSYAARHLTPLNYDRGRFYARNLVEHDPSPSELAVTRQLLNTPPFKSSSVTLNGEPAKGHVQPHVSNIPRRKRPTQLVQAKQSGQVRMLSAEEKKAKKRRHWEAGRCFQEVLRGSGIWVGFSRAVSARTGWVQVKEVILSSDSEEVVNGQGCEEEEFVEGMSDRVVRICVNPSGTKHGVHHGALGDDDNDLVENDGNVLRLFVSQEGVRDDGIPHLSPKQIDALRSFLSVSPPSSDSSGNSSPSCSSSSTLVSPSFNVRTASVQRRLCIITPPECAVDAIALAIIACLSHSHLSQIPSLSPSHIETLKAIENLSGSQTLAFLARLYDIEDVQMAWRGVLSCDGVELLEKMLEGIEN
ncbi:hypothetical protein VKT23_000306 [Stygiomarasmius scandens]|uniref:Uncharacterized protein n=1 Tax=Marasmiellus scandens TaxID=2682957 RepID=A0ABR1K432_9AGAR